MHAAFAHKTRGPRRYNAFRRCSCDYSAYKGRDSESDSNNYCYEVAYDLFNAVKCHPLTPPLPGEFSGGSHHTEPSRASTCQLMLAFLFSDG